MYEEADKLSTPHAPHDGRGHFFAVDTRCTDRAAQLGINALVAYLVLGRFTGRDQRTFAASVTAIHTRTGLTRGRSALALKALEAAGLVSGRDGKGYLRTLTAPELLAAKTDRQRAVIDRVRSGKAITSARDHAYHTAYMLAQGGALERTGANEGGPLFRVPPSSLVWLPNSLVDGVSEHDAPLCRLRQGQDVRAAQLLLDAYREANLPENAGLHWHVIQDTYRRVAVAAHGAFTVWGFAYETVTASHGPLVNRFLTGSKGTGRDPGWDAFFGALKLLRRCKLIEIVGHMIEANTEEAQILWPYALPDQGEEAERAVARAAHAAALRMVPQRQIDRAPAELGVQSVWLCPVPAHIADVQLIGIARPVYRPHTSRTSAWRRIFLDTCSAHESRFRGLAQGAMKSAA